MPPEEGRWRLLNPLAVRFSQPRIAPHYRDGHLLDETVAEVYATSLADGGVDDAPRDAAAGAPPYDMVLVAPFPAIRVISWLPKIRRPDGEAERDEYGDQKLGKRAWFALDNRRLHSMQCAAAARWPRRCCVVVRCIEEVPGQTIRELRKFRTTTEGRSVEVGIRVGDTEPWSWPQAAPLGARVDDLEAEGLYAEDLWDAMQWAPQAVAAASGAEGADAAVEPDGRAPALTRCPDDGWQYVDPSGRIQGPFHIERMRVWSRHNFFYPDLPMRCDPADAFRPFADLFPRGAEPFGDRVVRYKP
mmetsp:Transcript_119036/g.370815  ORF Transcript_119036/g.370815 Transcript_119036/m.370815 type:complete len:302 (+) Transcript_119036:63-968(+)